ncbi:hypothetical protein J7L67_06605 [bacterium]|nr:hypothetical protein [bacterium]
MFRKHMFLVIGLIIYSASVYCDDGWDNLYEIPLMPKDTVLFEHEAQFAYRGRIGFFALPPSVMGCYLDSKVNYLPPEEKIRREKTESSNEGTAYLSGKNETHMTAMSFFINQGDQVQDKELWQDYESIKVMYRRKVVGKSFCGAYIMILGDISKYSTLTFMIKGKEGGESFQIGMNDSISNKREDAVFIGSINRFLPGGVTRDWQMVKIPVSAFYGPDLTKVMSIVFDFNEQSHGVFWMDDIRFYKEPLVHPMKDVYEKGYLYLDDFNYSYLNLLGRKTGTYKKLPSLCKNELDADVFYGESGKSMRLDYNKQGTGWSGYYSLLNQIDGEWFDLSEFDKVSFMVKGKKGGEEFEIGLADRNWVIIGDSLKAGSIDKYLPNGVTTQWQEVVIPLEDFGLLDLTEMGSFVINFNTKQKGTIWIDDLKFLIKQEEEEEPDW